MLIECPGRAMSTWTRALIGGKKNKKTKKKTMYVGLGFSYSKNMAIFEKHEPLISEECSVNLKNQRNQCIL